MSFLESLNEYVGLLALLTLIASVAVPCIIYCLQRKSRRKAMQDELEAKDEMSGFAMPSEAREHFTKKRTLEKGLNKEKW